MSRRINFTRTDEQLAAVEHAMNHSPLPEVRQRATAIRLLHLGHKPEAVAEIVAVGLSTIWTWHRRYTNRWAFISHKQTENCRNG